MVFYLILSILKVSQMEIVCAMLLTLGTLGRWEGLIIEQVFALFSTMAMNTNSRSYPAKGQSTLAKKHRNGHTI